MKRNFVSPPAAACPSGFATVELSDWSIANLERAFPYADLQVNDAGLRVRLRRFRGANATRAVVLIHGASAGSRTFMIPNGGLVRYLMRHGYDVWTLDWRSSNLFATFNPALPTPGQPLPGTLYAQQFDLDQAVDEDLLGALDSIGHWLSDDAPASDRIRPNLSLVAHCVGGGLVAQALAQRRLTDQARSFHLGPVVLSTLALFYRVGLEGWLKGNEYLLEALTTDLSSFANPNHPVVSPAVAYERHKWPKALEGAFETWCRTPLAPNRAARGQTLEFINRISFMYGQPYSQKRLARLHNTDALRLQFGDMPLGIYMHCVRNLRAGFATPFVHSPETKRRYVDPAAFIASSGQLVCALTLLTGAENQVWHRDSIDRMYEWLTNHLSVSGRSSLTKHVFRGYAHQDLFWSDSSELDVYPHILAGIS